MELVLSTPYDGVVGIELQGRLDTPTVDTIETRFTAAAVTSGQHALVDLTSVSFVSSMGLRMLITVAKSMRLRRCLLALVVPPGPVRDMLETAAIDTIIPMFTSREDARTYFAR